MKSMDIIDKIKLSRLKRQYIKDIFNNCEITNHKKDLYFYLKWNNIQPVNPVFIYKNRSKFIHINEVVFMEYYKNLNCCIYDELKGYVENIYGLSVRNYRVFYDRE
jgi:hypothetical protein